MALRLTSVTGTETLVTHTPLVRLAGTVRWVGGGGVCRGGGGPQATVGGRAHRAAPTGSLAEASGSGFGGAAVVCSAPPPRAAVSRPSSSRPAPSRLSAPRLGTRISRR